MSPLTQGLNYRSACDIAHPVHVLAGIVHYPVQMLCSFIFWPLAAIMGVEIEDAYLVASLIGTKIFADEFISFTDLVQMVCSRQIKVTNLSLLCLSPCSPVFMIDYKRLYQSQCRKNFLEDWRSTTCTWEQSSSIRIIHIIFLESYARILTYETLSYVNHIVA